MLKKLDRADRPAHGTARPACVLDGRSFGRLAKAAQQLDVLALAVSEIIADLFAKRSLAAFDELRQSIRDIELLADPSVGQFAAGRTPSSGASAGR